MLTLVLHVLQYPKLVGCNLLRRYKRFLADVLPHSIPAAPVAAAPPPDLGAPGAPTTAAAAPNPEAAAVTVHCPNTGPMTGLLDR